MTGPDEDRLVASEAGEDRLVASEAGEDRLVATEAGDDRLLDEATGMLPTSSRAEAEAEASAVAGTDVGRARPDDAGQVGQDGPDDAGQAGQDGPDDAGQAGLAGADDAGQAGPDDAAQVGQAEPDDAGQVGQAGPDDAGQVGQDGPDDAGQAGSDDAGQAGPDDAGAAEQAPLTRVVRGAGRAAPAVAEALGRAASWARTVVQRRSRSETPADALRRAVGDLPNAGSELMVALDIDGTILHHDTTLSPRVAESVARLRDTGTHVMLATGRSVFSTVPVADQLGLTDRYAISSNGAVTVELGEEHQDGYRIDDVVTFDPEPALRALRRAVPDGVFAVEDVGIGFRLSSPFPPGELGGAWELVDFEDLCSREVTRLTLRAAHLDTETFHAAVRSAGMQAVTFAIGWSSWVDVAPEGVSKATALERVRQRLGVAPEATVTAGDGSNDVEMLAWAGLGVAMGGARPEVRAHARAAVAPVEEDGLADLLDQLGADR